MAFTFKELKQAKQNIMDAFGLSSSDAVRVVGYFNGGGPALCPDIVTAMINGDLSGVGPALVALGLSSAAMEPGTDNGSRESKTGSASAGHDDLQADNITAGPDMVPDGVWDDLHDGSGHDLVGCPDGFQNAPQRKESKQANKRTTKQKKTNTSPQALQNDLVKAPDVLCKVDVVGGDDLEHVQGESANPHELPPGLYDDICATLENYCRQQNMDPGKVHPLQWKSACIYVGQSIKARGLLRDYEREKSHGGVLYDGVKVAALLDIYDYICGQYKQVPFVYNFPRFAGISPQYFADYENRLTSSRVNLYKKALDIQKAGLIDAVTGGGSATVGNIFLSKALAGLQETVTIQHVSAASTPAAVALPVFGPDGGLLEEKRPE